jgi:PhzF family phenazine biosynthesis protein
MELKIFQIDAFTDSVFGGNPAAICPLTSWLEDDVLQAIALENNLSETAFIVPEGEGYRLRWFTPAIEVDLCGHATLATASLLLERLEPGRESVSFETRSGTLTVKRADGLLAMNFPSKPPQPVTAPAALDSALGVVPDEVLDARNFMVVYDSADTVRALTPDMHGLLALDRGVIATAPGDNGFDCVSRYFAPFAGIPEDPVTGSAHCTIVPYWANKLGKADIHAYQASKRGGALHCRDEGDRVTIAGRCAFYMEGTIHI